jgi:hypothetical protein
MATTPTIVVGRNNWGIKNGNLLGYYQSDDGFFVKREFAATRGGGTNGTFVGSNGFIQTAASGNLPRIDFTGGSPALLVEPAATNSIRNNTMVGAVTGSPGTLPTNWTNEIGTLTQTIVATGVVSGITYIDIRLSGTASLSINTITFETTTAITASVGQAWTESAYLSVVSAPNPPTNYQAAIQERNAAGTYLTDGTQNLTLTSNLTRYSFTRTLTNANTGRVTPALYFTTTIGQTYDFTIRIGLPQMELGSVATSVIPTTTSGLTRNADVISLTGATDYIGQTEGTIYAEVDVRNFVNFSRVISLSDGTSSNTIGLQLFLDGSVKRLRVGLTFLGSGQVDILAAMPNPVNKIAVGYKQNDFVVCLNGSIVGTNTSCSVPVMNSVGLGNINGVNIIGDRIITAAIYNKRLPNDQLQALTTL